LERGLVFKGTAEKLAGGVAESMMGSRSEGKRATMKHDNKHRTQVPSCGSNNLARNGKKSNGTQNHLHNACRRQFIRD